MKSEHESEGDGGVGSSKLLPCPHCGSDGVLYDCKIGWSVCCQETQGVSCDIGNSHSDWTEQAAIEMWNRRAESEAARKLHVAAVEFVNDWKKGDFDLEKLAACDAEALAEACENYRRSLHHGNAQDQP